MGDDRERAEVMKGLRSSAPFVRSKLGRRLHVRTVPEVIFVEDRNLDHAYRINEILSNLSELKSPSTASATPSEQE
jgi:ribosome-binding factor A